MFIEFFLWPYYMMARQGLPYGWIVPASVMAIQTQSLMSIFSRR